MLDEIALGRTNAEIAVRLALSPETIKSYISRMLGETGCADRGALAQWWQQGQATRRPVLVPWFGFATRTAATIAASALGVHCSWSQVCRPWHGWRLRWLRDAAW